MADLKLLVRSRRAEAIGVGLVLFLLLAFRSWGLSADPVIGLSTSTDVYTDPPQYTYFAQMLAKTGDINPYLDARLALFLNSFVTLVAAALFGLFGVSLASSNAVGLFLSFGSMVLFYLFIRKISSSLAGFIFLLMIGLNYNLIFYGKLPFLEHAMTFLAFFALVCLVYWPNRIGYLMGGISIAAAMFFGKLVGIVFVFPLGLFLLYLWKYEDPVRLGRRVLLLASGFLAVALIWLFVSYLPNQEQVTGYVGEQTMGLYGAPEGLESINKFVWKLVTFGDDSRLIKRMKPAAVGTVVFLALLAWDAVRRKRWNTGLARFNSGHVFIAAMIVSFHLSLMIWNYRPLRYQLVLIYPMCAAAAVVLSMLWTNWREVTEKKIPWLFGAVLFTIIAPAVYKFYGYYVTSIKGDFIYTRNRLSTTLVTLAVTVVILAVIYLIRRIKYQSYVPVGRALVAVIVLGTLYKGVMDFEYWTDRKTFTSLDNSKDLAHVLAPGALLSGPYAGLLTLSNDLESVIHMFGVNEPTKGFFARFPVTHLLVDASGQAKAKELYPKVMRSSVHLHTYHVGAKKVRLIRVAGYTGNPIADSYVLSPYEKLVEQYQDPVRRVDHDLALKYTLNHPGNISGYSLLGEAAIQDSQFVVAAVMFKKAVEFSPSNYNLNARLAKFLAEQYEVTGTERLGTEALAYYEEAIRFAPTITRIKQEYNLLSKTLADSTRN